MRKVIIAGILAAVAIPTAPTVAQGPADREYRREVREARKDYRRDVRRADRERREDYRRFDHAHPDPRYGNYRADRYYRQGNYGERRLGANDRVYRGADNRYYCRRNDGTTGLIIGALGGGVLGNVIAPGGSKTLGTILGGGAGGLLGRGIDRNNVRCR